MLYSEKMLIFTAKRPAQTVTVDGAAYRYVRTFSGRDKTLVLLNGGMNTLEMWMDYVEPLSNMCGKSRSFWRGWSNHISISHCGRSLLTAAAFLFATVDGTVPFVLLLKS